MQDVGLKVQALLDASFEGYRQQVHEQAMEELREIEQAIVQRLHAVCAQGPTLADLETITALLAHVDSARRQLRERCSVLERFVLDGL